MPVMHFATFARLARRLLDGDNTAKAEIADLEGRDTLKRAARLLEEGCCVLECGQRRVCVFSKRHESGNHISCEGYCTCIAFQSRVSRGGEHCKHITAFHLAQLALAAEEELLGIPVASLRQTIQ